MTSLPRKLLGRVVRHGVAAHYKNSASRLDSHVLPRVFATPIGKVSTQTRNIIVGVPTETKRDEHRVGLVPSGADLLVRDGHRVLVETGAGLGSSIPDSEYEAAGCEIVESAEEVYSRSALIVKVLDPSPQEWPLLNRQHTVTAFFSFAKSPALLRAMCDSGATCIPYEHVEDEDGRLPLLVPMSQVAGRLAIQEGAKYLEKPFMGRGIMLSGVPGVAPANVVVIGAGVVGWNATQAAAGLGAHVTTLDVDMARLAYLADVMPKNVTGLFCTPHNVRQSLAEADLVVGAVRQKGMRSPCLITRRDLLTMKPGACIVDVCIDQGGIAESSKPTTHLEPTYVVDQIVHYCVTNLPAAVPTTATYALTNATLPYIRLLAAEGWTQAAQDNTHVRRGVSIVAGDIVHAGVASLANKDPVPLSKHLTAMAGP
eukprot:jgi/Mesvir1/3454/Mv11948-RA.1